MTAAALALHLCEKPGLPEFLEDCTGLGRDGKFAELCSTKAAAKLHALRELFPHSRRHGGGTETRDYALCGSESALDHLDPDIMPCCTEVLRGSGASNRHLFSGMKHKERGLVVGSARPLGAGLAQ